MLLMLLKPALLQFDIINLKFVSLLIDLRENRMHQIRNFQHTQILFKDAEQSSAISD